MRISSHALSSSNSISNTNFIRVSFWINYPDLTKAPSSSALILEKHSLRHAPRQVKNNAPLSDIQVSIIFNLFPVSIFPRKSLKALKQTIDCIYTLYSAGVSLEILHLFIPSMFLMVFWFHTFPIYANSFQHCIEWESGENNEII